MVEVVGVEPTSEKRVPEASPCASFYSFVAVRIVEEGQPDATAKPCFVSGHGARHPYPLVSFECRPEERREPRLSAGRHGYLGREGEVIVRRYFLPVLRVEARHATPGPLCPPSKPVQL
jgi:hypothetical protein